MKRRRKKKKMYVCLHAYMNIVHPERHGLLKKLADVLEENVVSIFRANFDNLLPDCTASHSII
jgi:hypothetical protein